MCGIAGIFHRRGKPVNPEDLLRMTRTLQHRGPDEEGFFLNHPEPGAREKIGSALRLPASAKRDSVGHVGLGHQRLSIIDLASGQQPLANEDHSIWVTFNGEIYNFQSLKKELENAGHRFRSHSDTEVIVHGYEEWGEDAVKRFRGMFAFALWDENQQKLWLARDRIGKKPLYYLIDGDRLLFGSEIKALLEIPGVSREIDASALSDFLSLQYVPSPRTIFAAIRKLPAAHQAVITPEKFLIQPYWDLSFDPDPGFSEEQTMEELMEILEDATRMRMISEVPLGAFLSGGVDSSAVVAFMARVANEPVQTHAISFPVSQYDEARYAAEVAERFSTRHHEFTVNPEAIPAVEKLAWHYDEPFADPSAVPTYYVSRSARSHVTVSLSGDGGDENFAGYRRYRHDQRENQIRNCLPGGIRKPLFGLLGALYPKGDFLPQILRGKTFLNNVALDPIEAYFISMSVFREEQKQQLLNPEMLRQLGAYRPLDRFREIYDQAPAEDHLSRIQYLDMKTHLCEDILTKVDRASMAVSLEVRCPILDHRFMERAARIPSRWKLRQGEGKYIFKKALQPYLPREILYRQKMGFAVPIVEWLREDLKAYAKDLVLEGEASQAYFRGDTLARLWKEHQSRLHNHGMELWTVMMMNLWYRNFVAASPGSPR